MTLIAEPVVDAPTSAADVLASVRALAPRLAARAAEVEAGRRIPDDLRAELKAAGVFRLLLPPSHGGLGCDASDALAVIEALAAVDGSTGWTAMIGGAGWLDLAGLPRATFDELFDGSDVVTAGSFQPAGSIEPIGSDAYRVSGRWGFVSGCEHADVIYGNCLAGMVDGAPQLRIAVFEPTELAIEDTWDVSGLRGTGSHHVRADGVVVAAARTVDPLAAEPCLEATILRIPIVALLSCAVATVAVGIAQGAIDDIVDLPATKVPLFDQAALAGNPTFQVELATADAEVRAARAALVATTDALWSAAVAGDEPTLVDRARARATAVWVTTSAASVVDRAYRAGGGTSLYAGCALQRRLRDVHAVTQHFLVRADTLATAGAILAGHDVPALIF